MEGVNIFDDSQSTKIFRIILILLSFILISILSYILLLKAHALYPIDDIQFNLRRINEVLLGAKYYHIDAFGLNYFNGSAVMSYYPYMNLLPIILINYFIKSKILLIYVYFMLNIFISLTISFFSSLSFSKNLCTSYVFSVIYSISPVFMGYDIGMMSSMAFLPLAIFGFIQLLYNKKYLELTVGIIFIIFSHILSASIVVIYLIILLVINYNQWNKSLFQAITKSVIIVTFITSIIWIPMIYLSLTNNIHFPETEELRGIPYNQILKSFFGGADQMGLGTFVVLSIILSLFKYHMFNKFIKKCYIISCIAVIICSKIFPWKILPLFFTKILSHYQFTYRFLIVPILLLSYIFSYIITQIIVNKKLEIVIICLSLLTAIGLRMFSQQHTIDSYINSPTFSKISENKNHRFKMINNNQVSNFVKCNPDNTNRLSSAKDYYPSKSVTMASYINTNGMHTGLSTNYNINVVHNGYNRLTFKNRKYIKHLCLPLVGYKGEVICVYTDGDKILPKLNKHNMILLNNVPAGRHYLKIEIIQNVYLEVIKWGLFIIGIILIFKGALYNCQIKYYDD